MWAERNERGIEGDPPCHDCWVDLLPENADAHKIFNITRYQLVLGPGSAFDIRHDAIWKAIDEYEIQKRLECFEKVCTIAREWWIPKMNEKSEG
jgi:hypothetical protein